MLRAASSAAPTRARSSGVARVPPARAPFVRVGVPVGRRPRSASRFASSSPASFASLGPSGGSSSGSASVSTRVAVNDAADEPPPAPNEILVDPEPPESTRDPVRPGRKEAEIVVEPEREDEEEEGYFDDDDDDEEEGCDDEEACELDYGDDDDDFVSRASSNGEPDPSGASLDLSAPIELPAEKLALLAGQLPSDAAVLRSQLTPAPGTRSYARERKNLWKKAVKLPMYSVALAPIAVAAALCHHWYGCVNVPQLATFALGACLVVLWLNLSNDAWDAETSVDENDAGGKPESVVRLLGGDRRAARLTHAAAVAALLLGFASLGFAARLAHANHPATASVALGMLALATALGHAYQGPPFRLSYRGLGEPICFFAFGPLATGAFYLALAAGASGGEPSVWANVASGAPSVFQTGVLSASALVGSTTTSILFASHLHQEAGDAAAGKRSPVVRLGVRRAIEWMRRGLAGHHAVMVAMAATGQLPWMGAALASACGGLALGIDRFARKTYEERGDVPGLFATKYRAVRWHAAHALMLAVGVWIDPWMPWHLARVAGVATGAV